MAGTTTNYALDYPTSTDLVRNGATAIQTLATDVDTLLASTYLPVTTHVSTTTGYSRASGSTTFGAFTSAPTQTITTGKSGVVAIILTADMANSTTTGNGMALSYTLSSGAFTSSFARAITTQNARTGASFIYVHDLDANTPYTLTLQGASLAGTSQTLNVYNHTIQSINLG